MVMDDYDVPSPEPVIILTVEFGHLADPMTEDALVALFQEKGGFSCIPEGCTEPDEQSLRKELHQSYLACFHSLCALDTRRVREVSARFIICTKWESRDTYYKAWGLIRVHF